MKSNLIRVTAIAAILTTGGAMLAAAQNVPGPDSGLTDGPVAEVEVDRGEQRRNRGSRDGRGERDGRRGGGHGALLGVFGPRGAVGLIDAVDADANGTITQVEIDAFLAARVTGADADGDGSLSLQEFAPIYFEQIRPRMVDAFQRLDADGSGEVTSDEVDARFGSIVQRLDRDGDGALSPADRGRRG